MCAVLEEYEFCHPKIVFAPWGQNTKRTETTLAKRLAKSGRQTIKGQKSKNPERHAVLVTLAQNHRDKIRPPMNCERRLRRHIAGDDIAGFMSQPRPRRAL
jgi:hypothetical protein